MTFSQYAGIAIVPTFARIVLGVAFVSLGWCQLTQDVKYSPEEAVRLRALGVELRDEATLDADASIYSGDARILMASWTQDPEQDPPQQAEQDPPPQQQEQAEDPPAGDPPAELIDPVQDDEAAAQDEAAADEAAAADPGETPIEGPVAAKRMHKITLALDDRGVNQYAKLITTSAVIAEMVAGALILLGLFSRLCALVLAGGAGAALFLGSISLVTTVGNPLNLASNAHLDGFNILFRHLGLFVLALGVMLTGPGPLSLDRLLFRRDKAEMEPEEQVD